VFLFVVLFVEVIGAPAARAIPSAEVAQRGPLLLGSVRRLVELAPVRRTLFTPPPQTPAMTPLMNMDNTIAWEGPTRADWEEMRRMATVLMELFVIFAERFLLEPTRDN